MIFKSDSPVVDSSSGPDSMPAVASSTSDSSDDCDEGASETEDCSDDGDGDSQVRPSTDSAPNDEETPEDVQSYTNEPSDKDVRIQKDDTMSTSIATATQQDAMPTSISSAQESADAVVITSTFTMLVAPTQSIDASAADVSTSNGPSPTATL